MHDRRDFLKAALAGAGALALAPHLVAARTAAARRGAARGGGPGGDEVRGQGQSTGSRERGLQKIATVVHGAISSTNPSSRRGRRELQGLDARDRMGATVGGTARAVPPGGVKLL